MSSVTINNIKVDFSTNPPRVTFLQGCDMNIFSIQDTIRAIEESEQGMLSEFRLIAKIWGNENFSADGSQKDALSLQIQSPFVIDFELGPIPFASSQGNLLGTFVQQSVQINNAIGAVSLDSAEIEYAIFNGGVTYDEDNGYAGIGELPDKRIIGTPRAPSNNPYDARAIANQRGFIKGYVLSDMEIPATELDLVTPFYLHGFIFKV